jgi:hypothetical protein
MRHEIRSSGNLIFGLEVIAGGVGQTGLAATTSITIQRNSDGQYWNPINSAWQNAVYAITPMTEVSAPNMPGLYSYDAAAAYTAVPASADNGWTVKLIETTNSVLEYTSVVITDKMTVDANVVDWNGLSPTLTISQGLPDVFTKVINPNAIDAGVIANNAIDANTFAAGAIDANAIAADAIDADAVATAAITHLELGDFASQEISNAVWGADIFRPGYNGAGVPTDPAPSHSMAHAMLVQYLGQTMTHWAAATATPIHICAVADPTGTKFYSDKLVGVGVLGATEILSYIDRTAVIVKGLNLATAPSASTESYLGRITNVGTDGSGQFFQVKLTDEAGSAIPGGFDVTADFLVVKAETDATMHEVAHEVWEESVLDHATADTFGMFSRIMTGLAQFNHRITSSTYDDSGRLLSCRLVVYPSATDAENQTNALTTVEVTSTYDEKQNMKTFLSKEG